MCIGVPYGTHKWQVGDSSQQNGMFKMMVTKFKRQLITWKSMNQSGRPDVLPEDIISIVNYAWDHSFANVEGNKQAILSRGWYPYN